MTADEVSDAQADAMLRAVGLLVTWIDAGTGPTEKAHHVDHLHELLSEDQQDHARDRLFCGLLSLAGQLLTLTAEVTDSNGLAVLQAIAATYVVELPAGAT